MRNIALTTAALAAALALLASAGCENDVLDDQNRTLNRIAIISGNNQTERTGAPLADPIVVQVRDVLGNPKGGVDVRFSTAEAGASIYPSSAVTDYTGFASARFTLGPSAGEQRAGAATNNDSTMFVFTAVQPACTEESIEKVCDWTPGRIFITTTSSSLLSGSGSVIMMFDPWTGDTEKIAETDKTIFDLSFSPRGELFAVTSDEIYKVSPASGELLPFVSNPSVNEVEIESNPGGVLALANNFNVYDVRCAGGQTPQIAHWAGIHPRNLAVDPSSRDIYTVVGSPIIYLLFAEWDGRNEASEFDQLGNFSGGTGDANGMCMDSTGCVYITVDDDDNFRRIARWSPESGINGNWFDFYAYAGGNNMLAGRWGDITCLGDSLYIIDTRNDRLVVISTDGQWEAQWENDAFSLPASDTERYGIEASPRRRCP